MDKPVVIPKLPLTQSEGLDYSVLRKKGIEHIISLGRELWTDFNIHDPGITFLEALCYALTDLTYRTSFPTADLLAPAPGAPSDPARQGFFSARRILSVNPWTVDDFRKLLADVEGVKNAWLICKSCPCEMFLYAKCAEGKLGYEETEHPITIKGLYDVLLEFDEESDGDLNSGKVKYTFVFPMSSGGSGQGTIEARLPSWHAIQSQKEKFKNFRAPKSQVTGVQVELISGNKNDDQNIPDSELARGLRRVLYATLTIQFKPDKDQAAVESLSLADVPVKVWLSDEERRGLSLPDLEKALEDSSSGGIVARYLATLHRVDQVVADTMAELHLHRNLCEDFCSVDAVDVVDIGICLDLELQADADMERVLAEAYYRIAEYFAPTIQFYSLQDRLAAGNTVDESFNGPALKSGFIDDEQLASTQLKSRLYASDVINILSDIKGVQAVKKFKFSPYTPEGIQDIPKDWVVEIPARHQPRLYIEGSKILVFKNKSPFLPDVQELQDTLQMLRGENEPSALTANDLDLPVPAGVYNDVSVYYPVQYSLPQTYGVGPAGLPPSSSAERKGQAKQLRGYLLFFEHLLVNYLHQLKNVSELFAIDKTVDLSYFTTLINSFPDPDGAIYKNLTLEQLEQLTETDGQWLNRRNRFLDHMLARFAEQFSDYALTLHSSSTGKAIPPEELIEHKIEFLQNFPWVSKNRGRSFNYKNPAEVCSNANIAGLKRRIQLILGLDADEKILVVEHLLLRPRNVPGPGFPTGDPLLPVCRSPMCEGLCGEEDPYSFRLTVLMRGDAGRLGSDVQYRRFAEQTIRMEAPAHLALKVCWAKTSDLEAFEQVFCAWLKELSQPEPDGEALHLALAKLLDVFVKLKNVYPPATLHDCFEGSEDNEVFLGQTVINNESP